MTSMTDRQRWWEAIHFGTPDRVPYWDFAGIFAQTIQRWWTEGMPQDVEFSDFVVHDQNERAPIAFNMCPYFEDQILEDDGEQRIIINLFGQKQRVWSDGRPGMPEFLEYPIKTRADFQALKARYDPATPERFPEPFDEFCAAAADRDFVYRLQDPRSPGLFGPLRNLMGLEPLLLTMYDDPAWIHEMMEFFADFYVAVIDRVGPGFQYDWVFFFEDVGYKTSTLVSPEHFRKFMMAPYKRMTEAFRRNGTDALMIDSDGCNDPLIPLWIEAGFTGLGPMEPQAQGMGPIEIRKRFGRDLFLIGGIDKRVLAQDKDAVEREVMSKVPWFLENGGGYIPMLDHAIPPDSSYRNFLYYREVLAACCDDDENRRRFQELGERAERHDRADSVASSAAAEETAVEAGGLREEDVNT
jgi:uroporphyrinogen decarboxylase